MQQRFRQEYDWQGLKRSLERTRLTGLFCSAEVTSGQADGERSSVVLKPRLQSGHGRAALLHGALATFTHPSAACQHGLYLASCDVIEDAAERPSVGLSSALGNSFSSGVENSSAIKLLTLTMQVQ